MKRIAVIGYGYWGANIVRNLVRLLGPDSVICHDVDEARLTAAVKENPGIGVTDDYRWLMDDPSVDAVVISTPATTHFEIARVCLEQGKHVLVEKPFVTSVAEAQDLVDLAEKKERILMVGHVFLFNRAVEKLRELVQDGELGQVRYIYSVRTSLGPRVREDVNVVWDYFVHDAYILPYVLGAPPGKLRASGGAYLRQGIADVVFATLIWDTQVTANCTASWYDPVKSRRMVVVGSRRMLIYDEEAQHKITVFNRGYSPYDGYDGFGNKNLQLYDEGLYHPRLDHDEPLRRECEHFLACIRNGTPPKSDGRAGLETIRILEAVEQSLRNSGETVELVGGS